MTMKKRFQFTTKIQDFPGTQAKTTIVTFKKSDKNREVLSLPKYLVFSGKKYLKREKKMFKIY